MSAGSHGRMIGTLRLLWEGVLDLVYPPVCLLCETWDRPPICEDCYTSFTPITEPLCDICGRSITPPIPCRTCAATQAAGTWGFDHARAAGIYQGPLREAVHRLKYRRDAALGPLLGAYLADRCVVEDLLCPEWRTPLDFVIPVPLHRSRERTRGYNQAQLLCPPLADALKVPIRSDLVKRTIRTTSQVGMTGAERRANLSAQTFTVQDSAELMGRHILLVDDVFTTGTTVSACAHTLRAAGAASVIVVTLAAGG